jgi:hypothetical protein
MIRHVFSVGAVLGALAFVGVPGRAQDEPKAPVKVQKIEADELIFAVPEAWKSSKPTSAMRKAQISAPAAKGDSAPAELVLFVFEGGAGGVDANIDRWRRQFTNEDGDPPMVETAKVKGKNVDVTRVEAAGTYKDPFGGGSPKPGYRLYGAIVQTDRAGYFFKMVGPEATMKSLKPDFDTMLSSIEAKGR